VTLLSVLLQVAVVVLAMHAICLPAVVGVDGVRGSLGRFRANARSVAPTAVGLGVVLGVNKLVRDAGVELSWLVGANVTPTIHALEGRFVSQLQSVATPPVTTYFSFVYVFGYAFLLVFPIAIYALHDDDRPLRVALVAYSLNYLLGLVPYVLFVAYGPRNFMPELVESLLYTTWPQAQLLTGQVNANTNVFPSLHTSLAATVAFLAYRFRSAAPRWLPLAALLATSIAVSTMYLGIHWVTDVLAGIVLAAGSVELGLRLCDRSSREPSGCATP